MTWFVASLRDHDTHQATNRTQGTVTALCGHQFRPLTKLRGTPLDPLQICLTCAQEQRDTQPRGNRNRSATRDRSGDPSE